MLSKNFSILIFLISMVFIGFTDADVLDDLRSIKNGESIREAYSRLMLEYPPEYVLRHLVESTSIDDLTVLSESSRFHLFRLMQDTINANNVEEQTRKNALIMLLGGVEDESVSIRLVCSHALGYQNDSEIDRNEILAKLHGLLDDSDVRVIQHSILSLVNLEDYSLSTSGMIEEMVFETPDSLLNKFELIADDELGKYSRYGDPKIDFNSRALFYLSKAKGVDYVLERVNQAERIEIEKGFVSALNALLFDAEFYESITTETLDEIVQFTVNGLMDGSNELDPIKKTRISNLSFIFMNNPGQSYDLILKDVLREMRSDLDAEGREYVDRVISETDARN